MHLNLLAINTGGIEALTYLSERFIGQNLIDEFRIGYSMNQKMIIVPVHSPDGIPVGLVGRGVHEKTFKNSRNLPRSKTLFNLHRAKRYGGTVVVCESSFDAIRIHGAGYPNVVATLGGYISKDNISNLNRFFSRIIIMTDFDNISDHIAENCRKCYPEKCKGHNPGRDLGMSIANALSNKDIQWAMWNDSTIYPHDAKDAGDLTDDEIALCIKNAMSHLEYTSRNIY
jgi:5S rRNA maturation endonuclease (ribonuclease M5)